MKREMEILKNPMKKRPGCAERTEAMVAHLAEEEVLKGLEGQRQYLPTRLENGKVPVTVPSRSQL